MYQPPLPLWKRLLAWRPLVTRRALGWTAAATGVVALLVATPVIVSYQIRRDVAAIIHTAGTTGLGVAVSVDNVSAPLFGKRIRLSGLNITNPPDYQTSYLLTVATVDIHMPRRFWWLRNRLHASDVRVSTPLLTYESGEPDKPSNLQAFLTTLAVRGARKSAPGHHPIAIDRLTVAPGEIRVLTEPESDVVVTKAVGELILVDVGTNTRLYPADVLNAVLGRLGQTAQSAIQSSRIIRRATGGEPERTPAPVAKRRAAPARRSESVWDSIKNWFSELPGKVFKNDDHDRRSP
jgi:hypothetical protein